MTACTCCWFPAVMFDKNQTASCKRYKSIHFNSNSLKSFQSIKANPCIQKMDQTLEWLPCLSFLLRDSKVEESEKVRHSLELFEFDHQFQSLYFQRHEERQFGPSPLCGIIREPVLPLLLSQWPSVSVHCHRLSSSSKPKRYQRVSAMVKKSISILL